MNLEMDVKQTDEAFFAALLSGSVKALESILTEDFILIDVFGGSEISKPMLISALESTLIQFEIIEPAEVRARLYGDAAVVTGRTQMSGQAQGAPFTVRSRYAHVYVKQEGGWKLVSAQGTQIQEAMDSP